MNFCKGSTGVLTTRFGAGDAAKKDARRLSFDFAGLTPHRPKIHPPGFLLAPSFDVFEVEDEMDRVSLFGGARPRRYAVLL